MFDKIASLKVLLASPSAFLLGMYFGLWLPDIDLAILPVLHHRSIITHSILIPLLLMKMGTKFTSEGVAGLSLGISVHLAADAISPMVGFGLIYLPWPIKGSIGAVPSLLWIAGNAVACANFTLKHSQTRPTLLVALGLLVALSYAILNEAAFMPFVLFGIIASPLLFFRYRSKRKASRIDLADEP